MIFTAEQERAIQQGEAIGVMVAGAECIVVRRDIFERGDALDYSPWTKSEIDWLASEAVDMMPHDLFTLPIDP